MAEEPKSEAGAPSEVAAPEAQSALDLAGQSLGNALRLSFHILTAVIIILALLFFARGIFTIQPDQKALVLRFGRADKGRVMDQGMHYAYPYPIDEVISIWIKPRKVEVNTFWPKVEEVTKEQVIKGKETEKGIVNIPGAAGAYMLTGDFNILEARWDITYHVLDSDAALIKYYNKIGLDEDYPYNDERRYVNERLLIKVFLQSAVVREISRLGVFEAYPRGKTALPELVKASMNRMLQDLDCGIELAQLNLIDIRPPRDVKSSFDAVLAAHQLALDAKTVAERDAKKLLIEAAGPVGLELGAAIEKWWTARDAGRSQETAAIEKEISTLFAKAEGEAKTVLTEADTYKTRIVAQTKGDADSIRALVAESPSAVRIFLDDRHVAMLQDVLSQCYEKFLFRPMSESHGTLELWINRRPELLRELRKVEETR